MDYRQGSLHKTTLQSVTVQQSTTLAGVKRSHAHVAPGPVAELDNTAAVPTAHPPRFQQPQKPQQSRLFASKIVALEPASTPQVSEYSQRRAAAATPSGVLDRALLLSHPRYALPSTLVDNFASLGINEIYPWQKQCLMGPGLLNGSKNLVYTAPTGGGKSLVADVLMLKRVLETKHAKALLVLPYVALVQEKVRWLRSVVQDVKQKTSEDEPEKKRPGLWQRRPDEDNIRVVGFFGGGKVRATWSDFDIGVCTFEKVCRLAHVPCL